MSRSAAALRKSFATSIASPTAISIGGSDEPISPTAAWPAWMLTAIFDLAVVVPPEPVVEVGDHALDRARRPQRALRGIGLAPSWPNSAQMLSNST